MQLMQMEMRRPRLPAHPDIHIQPMKIGLRTTLVIPFGYNSDKNGSFGSDSDKNDPFGSESDNSV